LLVVSHDYSQCIPVLPETAAGDRRFSASFPRLGGDVTVSANAALPVQSGVMKTNRAPFRRRATLFAVLFMIAGFGALALWGLPLATPSNAPPARFTLLDGSTQALDQLRGRPVLVAFWSLSCPPCLEEVPDLARLYLETQPKNLALIAVAAPYDPPVRVRAFVETNAIPYAVALDSDALVARAFDGVPYLPAAFLIDPEGRIVLRHTGRLDMTQVQRIIQGFTRR
jgi:peroxiredoxin